MEKLYTKFTDTDEIVEYDKSGGGVYLELPDKTLMAVGGHDYNNGPFSHAGSVDKQINGKTVTAISPAYICPWCGSAPTYDSFIKGNSFVIPDNITYIGNNAFPFVSGQTLKLSKNLKYIGNYVFHSGDGYGPNNTMQNIELNEGIKYIGDWAFAGFIAVGSVTIPKSVEYIGENAFGYFNRYSHDKLLHFKIKCYKDTAGEEYAKDNGFEYEILDAPAHTHNYTSKITMNATCTATGLKTYTCSICGKNYTETIKTTGHKFGSWSITKKATCKTIGTQTRKCSVCGKTETKTIAKTAHSYKSVTVNSTYFVKGYTGKKCSVCGTITNKNAKALLTMATPKASSNSTSSVKLSWSKVKDAKGYDVYQMKNNKWSKIKTVTGTSLTVSKLKAGTNYKFCVKPYTKSGSKTVYGNQSKTLTATTKAKAVTLKVTAGKKKATLKWNKVTGATGYNVYYKTSAKGKWVKIKSANNKTTSYTKTKLSSKKTYWFKVDTIRKVGKTNYTTAGATKSITIK